MLTALLVTKDGARLLPACVTNLRRFADQVVIVADPGSQDATVTVAQALADTCVAWDTAGLAETVRQRAVQELCRGEWVLVSDDDELWPPAWIVGLPELLSGEHAEYVFTRRHIVSADGRWITSEPWWPDWQVRLRRRDAWEQAPWPPRPHSAPEAFARRFVNTPFWHLKFLVQPVAQRLARMQRWGELWPAATNAHYRKFAGVEDFAWQTAASVEAAPAELAQMLAAVAAEGETA